MVKILSYPLLIWFIFAVGVTKCRYIPLTRRLHLSYTASASSSHVSLQSGLRSSEIDTVDLADGLKSYSNTKYTEEGFEEEDIDDIGVKNEVEEVKAPERKQKKRTKNPLPSLTLDGRQLTFVEETKVTAEVDVLMKHNRVSIPC